MHKQYLLKHLVHSILFSVLLAFSLNKKTILHFVSFAAIYFAVNLLVDFIYGRMIDRKIRKELENVEKKEN